MQTSAVAVAAVACGAMGGVFFAFSTFVMAGLGRLPDAQGLRAMQDINVTAVTPVFMTALFGTAALCVGLAISAVRHWVSIGHLDRTSSLVLAGALLYLLGVIVMTAGFHVPRNDALAALDPAAAGSGAAWRHYLHTWTWGNHVRTVGGLGAAAAFAAALFD